MHQTKGMTALFRMHVTCIFLIVISYVNCQISLNSLQSRRLHRPPHPANDPPIDASQSIFLPTLIVPGSIEYRTTVDGVVIKFTTGTEVLTRITRTPTPVARLTPTSISPTSSSMIVSTRMIHEGVIEVLQEEADSNRVVSQPQDQEVIKHSVMTQQLVVFPTKSLDYESIPPNELSTVSANESNLISSTSSVLVLPTLSVIQEEERSTATSILSSSSHPFLRPKRVNNKNDSWRRLFDTQDKKKVLNKNETVISSTATSSPTKDRVRMNRLKLKVTNSEQLYDICLKDVCLRGQLPEAVLLLIGSDVPSSSSSSPSTSSSLSPSLGHQMISGSHAHPSSSLDSEQNRVIISSSSPVTLISEASSSSTEIINFPLYDLPLVPDLSPLYHYYSSSQESNSNNKEFPKRIKNELTLDIPTYTVSGVGSSASYSGNSPVSYELEEPSSFNWNFVTTSRSVSHDLEAGNQKEQSLPFVLNKFNNNERFVSRSNSMTLESLTREPNTSLSNLTSRTSLSSAGQFMRRHRLMNAKVFFGDRDLLIRTSSSFFHSIPEETKDFDLISSSKSNNFKATKAEEMASAGITNMPLIHYKMQEPEELLFEILEPTSTSTSLPSTRSNKNEGSYIPFLYPSIEFSDVFGHPHDFHKRHDTLTDDGIHVTRHKPTPVLNLKMTRRPMTTKIVRSSSSSSSSKTSSLSSKHILANSLTVKNILQTELRTKILSIIYNPDSTKYKTITHTSYYTTQVTTTKSHLYHNHKISQPTITRTKSLAFGSRLVT